MRKGIKSERVRKCHCHCSTRLLSVRFFGYISSAQLNYSLINVTCISLYLCSFFSLHVRMEKIKLDNIKRGWAIYDKILYICVYTCVRACGAWVRVCVWCMVCVCAHEASRREINVLDSIVYLPFILYCFSERSKWV